MSGQMPYQLIPVLGQTDEIPQLGCTLHQEVLMEVSEADGELALLLQGGALMDELGVDFLVEVGFCIIVVSQFIYKEVSFMIRVSPALRLFCTTRVTITVYGFS